MRATTLPPPPPTPPGGTLATTTDLRTPFFDCALEILGTDGYAGLKLAPLCSSMGVTTGAFYHSFSSWKDFTTQLLDHWRAERTTRLVELVRQMPDPLDQLENLLRATIDLPHQAEAAIRVWSAIDPDVAVLQAGVDQERLAVIRDAFSTMVSPGEAETFARAGMFLLIGFEQGDSTRDPHTLEWALRMIKQTAADLSAQRSTS
ncbi:TetR/AcrR family transcriptional regulator [Aeromicrobium stalagmiti]|uniref:TetR/AcrR family transcriptional regulator n=1 Tax=Aeromicrobium stalagmiti TaxID=2738988 RepID=UPI001568FB65|nr:TetR/AcrR family transcriptional regulator [Aeromicrobium stalagmiti]NRQ48412.1 TetR/AcrR family transcriptional regulator [Aeromicrobium stalagmiti]